MNVELNVKLDANVDVIGEGGVGSGCGSGSGGVGVVGAGVNVGGVGVVGAGVNVGGGCGSMGASGGVSVGVSGGNGPVVSGGGIEGNINIQPVTVNISQEKKADVEPILTLNDYEFDVWGLPIPWISPQQALTVMVLNCFFPGLGTMILGCFNGCTSDSCCWFLIGLLQNLSGYICIGWIWGICLAGRIIGLTNLRLQSKMTDIVKIQKLGLELLEKLEDAEKLQEAKKSVEVGGSVAVGVRESVGVGASAEAGESVGVGGSFQVGGSVAVGV